MEWVVAAWRAGGRLAYDYNWFIQDFRDIFDHPHQGQSGEQKLFRLHQGNTSMDDYAIKFRIMAADSGRKEPAVSGMDFSRKYS